MTMCNWIARALMTLLVTLWLCACGSDAGQYYYMQGSEKRGPVSEAELLELLDQQVLPWESLIWTEGMPDWAPAHLVPLGEIAVAATDGVIPGDHVRATNTHGHNVPTDALRFKPVEIPDTRGFDRPMRAASSLIPHDWTAEGGVVWAFGECAKGYSTQWSAQSPDGTARIQVLPTHGWLHFSFESPVAIPPDCENVRIESAQEFVASFLRGNNGRILNAVADPELVRQIPRQDLGGVPGGPATRNWADAVNVYVELGGTHLAIISVLTLHETMDAGETYGFGPRLRTSKGSAYGLTIFSAPRAEFARYLPAFYWYIANYRVDPAWGAKADKVVSGVTGDTIRSAGVISRMHARANSQLNTITRQSAVNATSSNERMQREVTEMIRGTETYEADTFSGEVELPFGYRRAFQLLDGSFVVTNDESFVPATDVGIDGRELTQLP